MCSPAKQWKTDRINGACKKKRIQACRGRPLSPFNPVRSLKEIDNSQMDIAFSLSSPRPTYHPAAQYRCTPFSFRHIPCAKCITLLSCENSSRQCFSKLYPALTSTTPNHKSPVFDAISFLLCPALLICKIRAGSTVSMTMTLQQLPCEIGQYDHPGVSIFLGRGIRLTEPVSCTAVNSNMIA